jgi:hypothetical protein
MRRRSFNIHERFLRHIWSKQYLKPELQTLDGRSIKVIDVGQFNPDAGPDFRNSKVKIGTTTFAGDVEIHRTVFDWIQHQHQEDPKYNSVILHVVLEADGNIPPTLSNSGRQIHVLVLGKFLAESIHTIWQKAILDERTQKSQTIRCYERNKKISAEIIEHWLDKLAVERLEIKLRRFEERLKQLAQEQKMAIYERQQRYNDKNLKYEEEIPSPSMELSQKDISQKEFWEQIMYEGIMEGLGYSKNREPFLRLAKNLTLKQIKEWGLLNEDMLEAVLFGTAGLLPKSSEMADREAISYARKLMKQWKEFRMNYHGELLHKADWQFFPTRPTNFPTLRLAAARSIIESFISNDLFRKLIQTLKDSTHLKKKEIDVVSLFTFKTDEFWKKHYNFCEPAEKQVCALGISRIHDIIINTLLPISLLYARVFKDKSVREGAIELYQKLPTSEINSITRFMEKQFSKNQLSANSASKQQAVIQLYNYYCSENRCSECDLGRILFG